MNFGNHRYLVTGGSGFLGQELIKRLLAQGHDVRVIARNEGKLVELKDKFPAVEIIVGDIMDKSIVDRAMTDVDGVYHLAAMKHVGLAEENVWQCIQSNILGTQNLLEATRKHGPAFMIGISTDKAASRKGVYGTTKFLMEQLFREYEKIGGYTKYRIVRYGNVIYSTGSVLSKWKEKILKGEGITITDPDATRFFWTVEQAVDLIFECLKNATDSKPYMTSMKSIRIQDLAAAMLEKYGKKDFLYPVAKIGLQPGENMHEIIVEGGLDSSQVQRYSEVEIERMI